MGKKDRKSGKKLVSRKKHHFHRKLRLLIFNLILLTGLAAWGYYWAYPAYRQWQMKQAMLAARPKLTKAKDGTSTSPAWHKLAAYVLATAKLDRWHSPSYVLRMSLIAMFFVGFLPSIPLLFCYSQERKAGLK